MIRHAIRSNSGRGMKPVRIEIIGEREIYISGKRYTGEEILSVEESNILNKVVDSFEDGGNRFEKGYEIYAFNIFKIKRKVRIIKDD